MTPSTFSISVQFYQITYLIATKIYNQELAQNAPPVKVDQILSKLSQVACVQSNHTSPSYAVEHLPAEQALITGGVPVADSFSGQERIPPCGLLEQAGTTW